MSKIVEQRSKLTVPFLDQEAMAEISGKDPDFVNLVKGFDFKMMIVELVKQAITDVLKENPDIKAGREVIDYYKKVSNLNFLGIFISQDLPKGMGVFVNKDGSISYFWDDFGSAHAEGERIKALFEKKYTELSYSAVLDILSYDVVREKNDDGTIFMAGVKIK